MLPIAGRFEFGHDALEVGKGAAQGKRYLCPCPVDVLCLGRALLNIGFKGSLYCV